MTVPKEAQMHQADSHSEQTLAERKAYYERFVFSQKFAQVDPWSERVSGKDKHEFRPLATAGLQAAE